MLLQLITVSFSKSTLKPSVYTLIGKNSLRLVCCFLFIFNANGLEIFFRAWKKPGNSLEFCFGGGV